jgi:hypothetical protein
MPNVLSFVPFLCHSSFSVSFRSIFLSPIFLSEESAFVVAIRVNPRDQWLNLRSCLLLIVSCQPLVSGRESFVVLS